jgi:hypothetical protein
MEIYLTFDDGIQAGTEEVLSVLKETGVKATFFLVGIQLDYSYRKNASACLRLLRDIYENHEIGNHSYSHANFYYTSYYRDNGVQIDNTGTRRSVVQDFEKSKDLINHYLDMIYPEKSIGSSPCLITGQQNSLARLPGRNSWFICRPGADRNNLTRQNSYTRCEKDSRERTNELFKAGYQLYGWDTEWPMTFDFHVDALAEKTNKIEAGGLDYLKEENVHPDFDMYADDNLGKDRLKESWGVFKNRIAPAAVQNKVIILMHDRAFRKGFAEYHAVGATTENIDRDTYSESGKLKSLIVWLKNEGCVFKTLSRYI